MDAEQRQSRLCELAGLAIKALDALRDAEDLIRKLEADGEAPDLSVVKTAISVGGAYVDDAAKSARKIAWPR